MDMISETTMDRVMNVQSGQNQEYLNAIHKQVACTYLRMVMFSIALTYCIQFPIRVLQTAGERMFNPLLQPNTFFKMTSTYVDQQKSVKICHQVVTDVRYALHLKLDRITDSYITVLLNADH